ncbi:MAG: zinc ABC transporter substrate-binding protein [Halomonadaceae bacterium]|nr:MAG: zinc ABC transporter substrate-binding protein [Halomonadaceae bacterium]
MRRISLLLLLILIPALAQANVRIAATVPNMGMLAKEIGGEHVQVTVMAPADRDPHYLDARPSMMAALRRADLVVAVGAELEVGWLPAAIQGAQNRRVQEGQGGYFEGAAHIERIGEGGPADRSGGDVHPMGNPHFYLDPERMATVGEALAQRLGRLDEANQDYYLERAADFRQAIESRLPDWKEQAEDAPGVVLYHKDADYLMKLLGVPVKGYLEPLPGIPPTAQHLASLVRELRGEQGVVLYTNFQPSQGGEFLQRELDWPARQLASQVPVDGTREHYFQMINQWVEALTP